jgi:hypothetical protein
MPWQAGAHICRCIRRPGIVSEELIRKFRHHAGIFKQSMRTRNRVGIGLLYQPATDRICKPFKEPGIDSQPSGPVRQPYLLYRLARLHRLAESIPGLLKHLQIRAQATLASGIGYLESIPGLLKHLQILALATLASGIGSLELIPGLLKRLQIRAQATLDSGIGSLESIPGLLKSLQILAQATLDSGIGSLESIPRLLKRLQIWAQTTLASGIGSLESIPRLHNLKNEDEDDFFGIETNIFVPQLSKGRRITNLFIPKLSKE